MNPAGLVAAAVPKCRALLVASRGGLEACMGLGEPLSKATFRSLALACSHALVAVLCECGAMCLFEEPDAARHPCGSCGRELDKLVSRMRVLLQATPRELETMLVGAA